MVVTGEVGHVLTAPLRVKNASMSTSIPRQHGNSRHIDMDDGERIDGSASTRNGEDVKKVLQHGYAQLESALSRELSRRR